MAYSDFTLQSVSKQFGITISDHPDLFGDVKPIVPGDLLRANLAEQIPLAISIQTEKARSELIIAPMLVELRRQTGHSISLFSGIDFTVDSSSGLTGVCDYLISQSPEQLYIQAPVIAVVEAKNTILTHLI